MHSTGDDTTTRAVPMGGSDLRLDRVLGDESVLSHFHNGGCNCEFGFVQRASWCEAARLLFARRDFNVFRFSSVPFDALVTLVESDFEEIRDPGRFEVAFMAPGHDLMLVHRGLDVWFHTFRYDDELASADAVRTDVHDLVLSSVARLTSDLYGRRKMLVVHAHGGIDETRIGALTRAFDLRGGADVLWVTDDGRRAPGTVERVGPSLLRGYLDRFADPAERFSPSWNVLCRNAYGTWRETPVAPSDAGIVAPAPAITLPRAAPAPVPALPPASDALPFLAAPHAASPGVPDPERSP